MAKGRMEMRYWRKGWKEEDGNTFRRSRTRDLATDILGGGWRWVVVEVWALVGEW